MLEKARGVTLIELMIAILIVSILASIAVPSYRQHVIRANRAAAQAAMLDIANREQQILIASRRYADTTDLTSIGYRLDPDVSGNYTWNVTTNANPVPTFLITFTAVGGQISDGPLTLDSEGNKAPIEKWRR